MILELLALALGFVTVFQTIYWSRQVHKLIDKLMSRNYAEYVHTLKSQADLPGPEISKDESEADDDLDQLNRVMAGIG